MCAKKKIRHPILQTWGSRCQGSERITPALTFTTAVAFHPGKRDDVHASLLFWVLGGLFRKPAQLSFDLSCFLAPVSPSVATHCRIAWIFLLAVLHLAKEFAAACEPPCVMSDFHTRERVSVKHFHERFTSNWNPLLVSCSAADGSCLSSSFHHFFQTSPHRIHTLSTTTTGTLQNWRKFYVTHIKFLS